MTNEEIASPEDSLGAEEEKHAAEKKIIDAAFQYVKWRYYFQKADLARQFGEWEHVQQLCEEAFGKNFRPKDQHELFPLIEAYFRLGQPDKANKIVRQIIKKEKKILEKKRLYPAIKRMYNRLNQSLDHINLE